MSEKLFKRTIVGLLSIGVIVSLYILAVDNTLWTYNSAHAYGLIGFIVVDLILIALVTLRPRIAGYLTMLWGGLQFVLLIGDAATGLGLGFDTGSAFRYLFLGEGNPSGMATTALLVLYVLIGLISLYEVMTVRRAAHSPQATATMPSPKIEHNGRRPSL